MVILNYGMIGSHVRKCWRHWQEQSK